MSLKKFFKRIIIIIRLLIGIIIILINSFLGFAVIFVGTLSLLGRIFVFFFALIFLYIGYLILPFRKHPLKIQTLKNSGSQDTINFLPHAKPQRLSIDKKEFLFKKGSFSKKELSIALAINQTDYINSLSLSTSEQIHNKFVTDDVKWVRYNYVSIFDVVFGGVKRLYEILPIGESLQTDGRNRIPFIIDRLIIEYYSHELGIKNQKGLAKHEFSKASIKDLIKAVKNVPMVRQEFDRSFKRAAIDLGIENVSQLDGELVKKIEDLVTGYDLTID